MTELLPLRVGDRLSDELTLTDHAGQPWRPAERRGQPLVLILHRHLA
jgi:hypothetical protein